MIWYVAFGSALGGAGRYALSLVLQQRFGAAFPIGTLVINITGSLLLGFLLRASISSVSITPEIRAMLTTGFCGGYTTFSTFSFESATLIQDGSYGRATLYILLSVVLGLIGMFAGFELAKYVLAWREGV
jgi:CrcB protein